MRDFAGRAFEIAKYVGARRCDIEIFGWFGQKNLGDEAMLAAALENLPARSAMGYVRRPKYGVIAALMEKKCFRRVVIGGGTLIHGGGPNANAWLDYAEKRLAEGADLFVFGTGVSFLQVQLAAKTDSVRRWAQVLKAAKHVAVRGPLSKAQLQAMGVECDVFGDLAFSLSPSGISSDDYSYDQALPLQRVGLNIGMCRADQDQYEAELIRLTRRLGETFAIDFYSVSVEDEAAVKRVIRQSAPAEFASYRFYSDPYAYMRQVRNNRFLLALRLHAYGLAAVAGVPALVFEYKPKCRDLTDPIGCEHALLPMTIDRQFNDEKIEDVLKNPGAYVATKKIADLRKKQKRAMARALPARSSATGAL